MNLLEVENVTHYFGGLAAVRDLSFAVKKGSIQGLIGPNGSGKSTAFNIIAGALRPRSGRVLFESNEIIGSDVIALVEKGISRTFQTTQVFGDFTVEENVSLSAQVTARTSLFKSYLRPRKFQADEAKVQERVETLLARLNLLPAAKKVARDLTYRDQKMLALANALATDPKLLMLDEPMAGLTSHETREAMDVIRWAQSEGMTVLLIEHDMRSVMELCERIVVLNHGEKICDGTPDEVRQSERVIETYLGAG